jgi:hypothetical protein
MHQMKDLRALQKNQGNLRSCIAVISYHQRLISASMRVKLRTKLQTTQHQQFCGLGVEK